MISNVKKKKFKVSTSQRPVATRYISLFALYLTQKATSTEGQKLLILINFSDQTGGQSPQSQTAVKKKI